MKELRNQNDGPGYYYDIVISTVVYLVFLLNLKTCIYLWVRNLWYHTEKIQRHVLEPVKHHHSLLKEQLYQKIDAGIPPEIRGT